MATKRAVIPVERIEQSIYMLRGMKVMFDSDLAALYGVETRALVQAVHRNIERFPEDFMFQTTKDEFERLKSQNVISSSRWGGRRYPPYAFTEQGVAMLATVLRSERAVQVSIAIMRTFVRLRALLATNNDLARRLDSLEKKYDTQFKSIFEAIRRLAPGAKPKRG